MARALFLRRTPLRYKGWYASFSTCGEMVGSALAIRHSPICEIGAALAQSDLSASPPRLSHFSAFLPYQYLDTPGVGSWLL